MAGKEGSKNNKKRGSATKNGKGTEGHRNNQNHSNENDSKTKKRRAKEWKDGYGTSRPPVLLNNPKRGAPAILLTCDRGRELKCQREALQIIHHYYEKLHKQNTDEDGTTASTDLGKEDSTTNEGRKIMSLEEELKFLQKEDSNRKNHVDDDDDAKFGIFSTGCSGVVFALCTVPGSEMIPPVKESKKSKWKDDDNDENDENDGEGEPGSSDTGHPPDAKKQKLDPNAPIEPPANKEDSLQSSSSSVPTTCSTKWDPVPVVHQILQDIENDTGRDAPGSRFVSRMIPLQATCYVSEEELQIASRLLIQQYFPSTTTTFAISVKRRFCIETLPKAKIIDIMAASILEKVPNCKVNLDHPDVTLIVEICKTICGLAVISKCQDRFKNFNLAEARTKSLQDDDDDDADDDEKE